jgi:Tripartite tricarboxylate transporter TctB family
LWILLYKAAESDVYPAKSSEDHEGSMIRSTKDFWTGGIYIALGASAILIAREYGMGTALKMGPAYFPTVLGALLVLIGAIAMIRAFLVEGTPIGALAVKPLAIILGSIVLFGFIVRGVGLLVALPLLVILSAYASVHFRWLPALVLAAGLTVFCIMIFVQGLGVPLPIIGPWLGG